MLNEKKQGLLDSYNSGLALYRQRKFKHALDFFKKGLEFVKDDGPCMVYIERCNYFLKTPPPADWDGVFVLKTK